MNSNTEKKKLHPGELKTIQEGNEFNATNAPKIVNLDKKLKESYPDNFLHHLYIKSKHKKSKSKTHQSLSKSPTKLTPSKRNHSATKSLQRSPQRSQKK